VTILVKRLHPLFVAGIDRAKRATIDTRPTEAMTS
jgi:hypothetical protein